MKVHLKDLDPDQVNRMKGVYGLSEAQILQMAQNHVDPHHKEEPLRGKRRGSRFKKKRKK